MGNPFVWGQILIHAKYHEVIKKKRGEIEMHSQTAKMSHVSTETVSGTTPHYGRISARTFLVRSSTNFSDNQRLSGARNRAFFNLSGLSIADSRDLPCQFAYFFFKFLVLVAAIGKSRASSRSETRALSFAAQLPRY